LPIFNLKLYYKAGKLNIIPDTLLKLATLVIIVSLERILDTLIFIEVFTRSLLDIIVIYYTNKISIRRRSKKYSILS